MSLLSLNNSFLYNLLIPVEIILTLIIYFNYVQRKTSKRYILICMFLFIIFSILNLVVIQDFFKEFANHTFFAGGIIVSYLSYSIWLNDIKNDLLSLQNVILWFTAANFIYYTTTIPIISAHNWLSTYSKEVAFPIFIINLVMYGLWAIIIGLGFIWKRQTII